MSLRFIDLTGKKVGRLTVIRYAFTKNKNRYWECKCECGNTKFICTSRLTAKSVESCGCAKIEATIARSTKHGYSKRKNNRLHNIHSKMILRCENPNNNEYKRYGARGIKVCKEWHDLKTFGDWAMLNGYNDDLQIDRIDNNGDYCPENCRWVTPKINSNNKRNTIYVVVKGEKLTLSDVSEKYGIRRSLIHRRYYHGITDDKLIAKSDLRFKKGV